MSARINRSDLEKALRHLHRCAEVPMGTFELETWAPGDSSTRYRIASDSGSRNPFGHNYWLGSQEAYYGIHAVCHGIEWAKEHKESSNA